GFDLGLLTLVARSPLGYVFLVGILVQEDGLLLARIRAANVVLFLVDLQLVMGGDLGIRDDARGAAVGDARRIALVGVPQPDAEEDGGGHAGDGEEVAAEARALGVPFAQCAARALDGAVHGGGRRLGGADLLGGAADRPFQLVEVVPTVRTHLG